MSIFHVWFIVAVITFSFLVYTIGRSKAENSGELLGAALVVSLLWFVVLAILPFYVLYTLGAKKTDKQLEKDRMWDLLKH